MKRLNCNQSLIIRYQPNHNPKARLIVRTHDLAGTDYDTIKVLEPKEVSDPKLEATFLYDDERMKFIADHITPSATYRT